MIFIPGTIAGRVFLAVAFITLLLLALAGYFTDGRFRELHQQEVARRLRISANLLAESAGELLDGSATVESLAPLIERVQSEKLRLTIIRTDGEVLADSEAPLPLPNHRHREELVQAAAETYGSAIRRSTTTGRRTYYLARRLEVDGRTAGFVRVAAALDDLRSELGGLYRQLAALGLGALLLGLFCALLFSRYLARPIQRIEAAASNIASGNHRRRISVSGPPEIRRLAQALNALGEQIQRQIEDMHSSQREMLAIHESIRQGVVAVDAKGRVILMNDSAARFLALEKPLDRGASFFGSSGFPELEAGLRSTLESRRASEAEAEAPFDDTRTLAISVAPVHPGQGAVALLADVTSFRRFEKVRIDFVANVSHEMRTPLTAVLGALETLKDPATSEPDRARFLDIATRNAIRMQSIVADLLELSQIEVEGDRMPMEPLSLDRPVRSAAKALIGTAEAKQIDLKISRAEGDLTVSGNEQRLEQVFTNLIDNAIKYTPSGGRIEIVCSRNQNEAVVQVTDTGVGLPPAALPRVFERFYRVDKSRSREMGGTGLGLAIVKHCVRVHGGRVEVRSQEGVGTTFLVALPLTV